MRFVSKGLKSADTSLKDLFQCYQCKVPFKKGDHVITETDYNDKLAVYTIYTYHLECV